MELFFPEDPAEFAEGEEWDEGAEDDDGAGNHGFELQFAEDRACGLVMVEAFYELLDEVEEEDEDAEEDGLENGGLVERAAFYASTEVHHLADEDHLADDEGIDECEGVVEGIGVEFVGDEVGVGHDSAEEDR